MRMLVRGAAHVRKCVRRYLKLRTMERHMLSDLTNVVPAIVRKPLIHARFRPSP
jgi:hypothetical protein